MLNGISNMMYGFLDEVVDNMNKMKYASRKLKSGETVAAARIQRLIDMKKLLSGFEDTCVDKQKGKTDLQEVTHN